MLVQRNKFFNFKSFEFLVPGFVRLNTLFLDTVYLKKQMLTARMRSWNYSLSNFWKFSEKHLSKDQLFGKVYKLQSITDVPFFRFLDIHPFTNHSEWFSPNKTNKINLNLGLIKCTKGSFVFWGVFTHIIKLIWT